MNLRNPQKVAVKLTRVDRRSNRESNYVDVGESLTGYCYGMPTDGRTFKFFESPETAPSSIPRIVVTTPIIEAHKVTARRYQFLTRNSLYELEVRS